MKIADRMEIAHYYSVVDRKKKAMELREKDPERFEKWMPKYEEILTYLRDRYQSFLLGTILRTYGTYDRELMDRLVIEKAEYLDAVKTAIDNADTDQLAEATFVLHAVYACWQHEKKMYGKQYGQQIAFDGCERGRDHDAR